MLLCFIVNAKKKIFPSAKTLCTSPAPDMAEDARPSTSSGSPAGIETPDSSSMSLDFDVTRKRAHMNSEAKAVSGTSFQTFKPRPNGKCLETKPYQILRTTDPIC